MQRDSGLKVLFVTHYAELYGANRSLLNLIEGLKDYRVSVVVITPEEGKITAKAKQLDIQYWVFPFLNEIHYGNLSGWTAYIKYIIKFIYNWLVVIYNCRRIKKAGFDIIHTNTSATLMGAYFSRCTGIPHVWHIREFGWEDYRIRYNYGYRYFTYWLKKAAAVIGISKAIYNARINGVNVKSSEVIYNGVIRAAALAERRKKLAEKAAGKPKAVTTFAMIGNIAKEKDQQEGLEAFALLSKKYGNIEFWIVGTGEQDYIGGLQQIIQQNELQDKVRFTGFIEDVETVYEQIDCLLMCSKNEAMGRVTIEAMSHGVPVIGYDSGGTTELICNDYNGFLYKNGKEELAGRMAQIMADDVLFERLSNNCIDWVEKHFTIEQYVSSTYQLYQTILHKLNKLP